MQKKETKTLGPRIRFINGLPYYFLYDSKQLHTSNSVVFSLR